IWAAIGTAVWLGILWTLNASSETLFTVSQGVGTLGLITLSLVLALLIGVNVTALSNRWLSVPPLYKFLGYRHFPILSLVGLWWIVAGVLPPTEATNDARLSPPTAQLTE